MWLMPVPAEGFPVELWWVVGGAVVLALLWTLLRFVLKLTMKVFAIGCLGVLIVAGVAFVMLYGK